MTATPLAASMSRRRLFGLAGAAGVASVAATPWSARSAGAEEVTQAPAGDPALQGAGFFGFEVGALRCRIISDGGFPMNSAELFPQAPPDALAEACDAAFLAGLTGPGQVNALLIESDDATVLVDTGCGTTFGPTTGKLRENLARAGVDPASIDTIVITHLHPDHVGGLLGGALTAYPNARVVLTPAERAFWSASSPDLSRASVADDFKQVIIAVAQDGLDAIGDRLDARRPGDEVMPGVTLVDAPGHTPGHVGLQLQSGGRSMLYITDAVHFGPVQFAHPDWPVAFDADPAGAVETRRTLLNRAAADRVLISGAHLPFPSLGHVAATGERFAYVPRLWDWTPTPA